MLNFWPFNIRAKRLERMRAEQRRYEEENRRKHEERQRMVREQHATNSLNQGYPWHEESVERHNPAQAMNSILASEPVMSGSSDFGSSSSSSSCGSDF